MYNKLFTPILMFTNISKALRITIKKRVKSSEKCVFTDDKTFSIKLRNCVSSNKCIFYS